MRFGNMLKISPLQKPKYSVQIFFTPLPLKGGELINEQFAKSPLGDLGVNLLFGVDLKIKLFFCILSLLITSCTKPSNTYDIVVYGGTSAGISAAIQAARMNKSVVIIEPGTKQQLGGLTTGGLGRTDFGNKKVIGGISLEFYQALYQYYLNDSNWIWQNRNDYFENQTYHKGATNPSEKSMWFFEPSAARKVFQYWIDKYNIPVVFGERIIRLGEGHTTSQAGGWHAALPGNISEGVIMKNKKIVEIIMESGTRFRGKYFIDATYEGDLMACSGVSFTIGREGEDVYNETLNGVRAEKSIPAKDIPGWQHHQFEQGVDPYVITGHPESGLLPMIDPTGPGKEGSSDNRIQAYCFRMCLTDNPENQISFIKPEGYNETDYELLLRNYEAGFSRFPWINSPMPNRKTDTNNQSAFSSDFIGANYGYPEGSYQEREEIIKAHRRYQQGLMWTLANHPRVPAIIRDSIAKWGMTRDEFIEGYGWQDQLYIREARRMISDVVITQHHCQGREVSERSIGLGAYNMDSHHTQRYVDEGGFVKNEGDIQVPVSKPYPIDYGSIVPKEDECINLFVPVCLSSSHIAFGSIRMEPVFMILGQSAAVAASIAIDKKCAVQKVPYEEIKALLLNVGQILYFKMVLHN